MSRRLPRSFYNRPTLEVARDLLGKHIVYNSPIGKLEAALVEVEAYIGEDDPACHAAPGPTARNLVMYGKSGFSYVYFIYGMYHCFNIVTERKGFPAAVLVRAAEPIEGLELMKRNSPHGGITTLLSGPGKFCRSFGLTTRQSGLDLTGGTIYLCEASGPITGVVNTRRVGINKGIELPYRFFLKNSKAVSGPQRLKR